MTEKSNQQSDSRQFEPGKKVRTEFGELRTVWEQRGNQVFVVEEPDNVWYPADKLTPIASA
jgi:hypothetical protein